MTGERAIAGEIRPAILMPTYNNAGTLPNIVSRSIALGLPIIVVNDGSIDGTAEWLAKEVIGADEGRLHVVTHSVNRGKAAALQSGFARALELGCTHAVTIDTDGQLDPEEIPLLLEAARTAPEALVLGFRDDRRDDYPARSRIGRRLSNLAIRLECGARVFDSQCGLRAYPLTLHTRVPCRAGRFGYEAEIITRAVWAGYRIVNVPVRCRYLPGSQRVTHFRPWRDSLQGIQIHTRLLLTTLLGGPPGQLVTLRTRECPAARRAARGSVPGGAMRPEGDPAP